MGILIKETELTQLRNTPTPVQKRLIRLIQERVRKNTAEDQWVQSGDTQEWYHLCWERMSDAAFAYALEPEERLGRWIHNRTMSLVQMDHNGWLGPWYRNRKNPENPVGSLETSHITLAVCEAYDICPCLFSETEQDEIRQALREKALPLCKKFASQIYVRKHINNWHIVLLNGYTSAAVLLGDREEIRNAVQLSRISGAFFGADSYGESVQYSNYAAIHQSFLYEILLRSGCAGEQELDLSCCARLMEWYAASFLYRKQIDSINAVTPRTINFGDSSAIFRPCGDVLAQVASRLRNSHPQEAALASWLFETLYAETKNLPDELASFGFFNQFHYLAVLMQPEMCQPLSPKSAGISLVRRFTCGHIIARDDWENPRAVIAIAAGYEPCNVTSHRHADQNSFQLAVGRERMLTDPGHCCYRLRTQQYSASELAHNTISLERNGQPVPQRLVSGSIFDRQIPGNRLLYQEAAGSIQVIASDAAGLYDENVRQAVRIWVFRLPGMFFIADLVRVENPVILTSQFSLNNRGNLLQSHIYNEHRLVFRRNGEALKLFEISSQTDHVSRPSLLKFGWSYLHDYYHPLPNQAGQGKEGSALTYLWRSPDAGKLHLRIHTIAAGREPEITGWHVFETNDGFFRIESPQKTDWLDFQLQETHFSLRSPEVPLHIYPLHN